MDERTKAFAITAHAQGQELKLIEDTNIMHVRANILFNELFEQDDFENYVRTLRTWFNTYELYRRLDPNKLPAFKLFHEKYKSLMEDNARTSQLTPYEEVTE